MRVSDKDIRKCKLARRTAMKLFMKTGKQSYLHRADQFDKELSELKREQTRRLQ